MNIIIYGNSGSGKSTFAARLSARHPTFKHINTGEITRMMARFGCHNLPVLVQTIIDSLDFDDNHIFDHFYMHTWHQLYENFGTPIVVEMIDKTSRPKRDSRKTERFEAQHREIQEFFVRHSIKPIKVYNTDYGFDVSELINAGVLPFSELAVI